MSIGRVAAIAAVELRHAWRRPLWIVLAAVMLFAAWGFVAGGLTVAVGSSAAAGERAWINSQFNMSVGVAVLYAMVYAFWFAIGAGMPLIDDDSNRVGPVLHATPLTAREYVWGRFLGVFAVVLLLVGINVAAYMLCFELYPIDEPDKARGPFQLVNYLWVFALFALPSTIFFAGTSFTLGALTRRPVLVFVLPVAALLACLFFVWTFSPRWLPDGVDRLLQAVDPAGVRWLTSEHLRERRPIAYYNHEPIRPDWLFGLSRLAFAAIGIGGVAWAARREARLVRGVAASGDPKALIDAADRTPVAAPRPVERAGLGGLAMTSRRPGFVRTALVVMGAEMRELVRSPGLYLFIPLIVIQVAGVSLSATGAFDTEVLATPGTIAARSFNTVTILSLLLLLFYFTESLWREHRWRVAPITSSTPASSAAMLLGKMAAILIAVEVPLLAGVTVAALVTLTIQAAMSSANGGTPLTDLIGVAPLFEVWSAFLLPTVVLWMAFLALVWSVVRSRFAVYGIALAVLVGTGLLVQFNKTNWVSNWHLWSGVQWTDFGSFQLDRTALVLNRLFALSLAALFTALALWFWPRRLQDPQSTLAAFHPARAWRGAVRALLWALPALILGTTLALEVRHGREGGILERQGKNYRRANVETWKDADQPAIKAIDAEVEIDPDASAFVVKGTYTLRNGHDRALPRFAVTPGTTFEDLSWTIGGEVAADGDGIARNSAGLWEFTPRQPIPPGGEIELGFAYHGVHPRQPGRNPSGAAEFILPSGVVLTAFSPSFLPVMGFVDGVGLGDDPPPEGKRPEPEAWRGVTPPLFGFGYDTMVRLAVTGPADFRFNGPGVLLSDTVADDKRTMVWQTDAPVRIANLVGGRLVEHKGEGTSIWHLPAHHWNLDDMQLALDSARRWYSEWFWPYPWKELRLTEFPGLAGYAQGFGSNITFSESIGFLADRTIETDAPFMITAHESAHQWWGNVLLPGKGPGGNILSEGMAHFSTALLSEQVRGPRGRMNFLRGIERDYVQQRNPADERPMVEVDGTRDGDTTIVYNKGGWVFWMLLDRMGREPALAGIRDFIGRFKDGPDFPLLQDFVAVMREHAPDQGAFDAFVAEWFFGVVLPEYELTDVVVGEPSDGGTRRVAVTVRNKGTGRMPIEVAVTNGEDRWTDKDWEQRAEYVDARGGLVLGAGESGTVEIECAFPPSRVVVDPDVRVLQFGRRRAVRELEGNQGTQASRDQGIKG